MATEGRQELTQQEIASLQESEERKFRRTEIPKRILDIYESLLFDKVKVPKNSFLEDVESE